MDEIKPDTIAVLGAGLMGAGIFEVLGDAGYAVSLFDSRRGVAQDVHDRLRSSRPANKQPATMRAADTLEDAVVGATIVVEAVSEDLSVKHELYADVASHNTDAVIASNSSTFMPSELGAHLDDPSRLLVAHFFNPATIVPLVELVPSPVTAPAALTRLQHVLKVAGKVPVTLEKECPGFVANRLQAALVREAFSLFRNGVLSLQEIDTVVSSGLGPRWATAGPFQIMDLGGLEVWRVLTNRLFPELANDAAGPTELAEKVQSGFLGAQSGSGFYDYTPTEVARFVSRMTAHFNLVER